MPGLVLNVNDMCHQHILLHVQQVTGQQFKAQEQHSCICVKPCVQLQVCQIGLLPFQSQSRLYCFTQILTSLLLSEAAPTVPTSTVSCMVRQWCLLRSNAGAVVPVGTGFLLLVLPMLTARVPKPQTES